MNKVSRLLGWPRERERERERGDDDNDGICRMQCSVALRPRTAQDGPSMNVSFCSGMEGTSGDWAVAGQTGTSPWCSNLVNT